MYWLFPTVPSCVSNISSPQPAETRNLLLTVPPNHSMQSSKPLFASTWSMMVPVPTPFSVRTFSSLSGLSSFPENSTRTNSSTPLLSLAFVPPNGTPWSPSARHSPPGQLTGAAPLSVRPPQSPWGFTWPLLLSTWLELVMRIGWLEVPAALIREPRRKISAETFVGPPFCDGGFLPTTSVPGSMVIVTPACTNVRPSTSQRPPAGPL